MSSWNVCPRRLLKLLDMNSRKKILTKGFARTRYCSHSYVSGVSDCLLRVVFFCKFFPFSKKRNRERKVAAESIEKALLWPLIPCCGGIWLPPAIACSLALRLPLGRHRRLRCIASSFIAPIENFSPMSTCPRTILVR